MAKATQRVRRATTPRKTTKRKTYDINTFPQLFQALGGIEHMGKKLLSPINQIEDWARFGSINRGHSLAVYLSLQARRLTCHPKLFGLGGLGWRWLVIPQR